MQSPPAASATLIEQKPKIKTRKEGTVAAPTNANAFDIMPGTETKAGNVSKGIAKHFLKSRTLFIQTFFVGYFILDM